MKVFEQILTNTSQAPSRWKALKAMGYGLRGINIGINIGLAAVKSVGGINYESYASGLRGVRSNHTS